jgi:glyoxalase family protein
VNFDVPDTYHIYFGDRVGTPGTAMTFFGWPHLPWGPQVAGQVHTVGFAVPRGSLDFWERRLGNLGIRAEAGPGDDTLTLQDPDGIALNLVGEASDSRWLPWEESPVDATHQVRGFHSVGLCVQDEGPTARFLTETFGFREIARDAGRVRFQTGEGGPHAILELLVRPDAPQGAETTGTVHHVAWRAADDAHELAWREALVSAGRQVTPVIDRKYFHSIYFREPAGVLFEIATDQPGFTIDESVESLGSALQLPPQHEGRRDTLRFNLPPINVPRFAGARDQS